MAGGKFNDRLNLNTTNFWVEWPEGPLFPSAIHNETIVRVEAWVMQKTTNALQMTFQTKGFGRYSWKADQIWWPPKGTTGRFQLGPAMGTAVLVATAGGNQSYYWWSEEVEIV